MLVNWSSCTSLLKGFSLLFIYDPSSHQLGCRDDDAMPTYKIVANEVLQHARICCASLLTLLSLTHCSLPSMLRHWLSSLFSSSSSSHSFHYVSLYVCVSASVTLILILCSCLSLVLVCQFVFPFSVCLFDFSCVGDERERRMMVEG